MSDANGNGHGPPTLSADGFLLNSKSSCGAKKKNSEGFCPQPAMSNGRCRLHGGKTPGGIASPQYKHGRFSKYMPKHLLDRYDEAMNDPELTHLRSDIAVIDSLLADKLQSLDVGESESLWLRARELAKEYRDTHSTDGDGFGGREPDAIFAELEAVLHSGQTRLDIFAEIQPILEQRRKTSESENKRLKDLNQTMSAEQAIALVRVLADSVKRHVADQKIVQAISEDFTRALSRGGA